MGPSGDSSCPWLPPGTLMQVSLEPLGRFWQSERMTRPDDGSLIEIHRDLRIPSSEISFTSSRSSGPGGQNVNKVSTRVTLLFNVAASPSLTKAQKERLWEHLGTRISQAGVLQVNSQEHRSQLRNRQAALGRFERLLRQALHRPRPRRPTRKPRRAKEERLRRKKQRGQIKKRRSGVEADDF